MERREARMRTRPGEADQDRTGPDRTDQALLVPSSDRPLSTTGQLGQLIVIRMSAATESVETPAARPVGPLAAVTTAQEWRWGPGHIHELGDGVDRRALGHRVNQTHAD